MFKFWISALIIIPVVDLMPFRPNVIKFDSTDQLEGYLEGQAYYYNKIRQATTSSGASENKHEWGSESSSNQADNQKTKSNIQGFHFIRNKARTMNTMAHFTFETERTWPKYPSFLRTAERGQLEAAHFGDGLPQNVHVTVHSAMSRIFVLNNKPLFVLSVRS